MLDSALARRFHGSMPPVQPRSYPPFRGAFVHPHAGSFGSGVQRCLVRLPQVALPLAVELLPKDDLDDRVGDEIAY